jgi:hypothetical protein
MSIIKFFKSSGLKNAEKIENKYIDPIGILEKSVTNASKAKFYHHNQDIFLRYFDSIQQYEALILAGNFGKMEEIIKSNKE